MKWVFKVDAGSGRRTLLARGRSIDPQSLRLRGSRVAWTQTGDRRRATLR
jgi:hypothetical protein